MNKLKKIGVSALAGSLVAFSASAADWSVSGSAGFELMTGNDKGASTWYQYDSVKISASGTTDNGINVSAMFELDGISGSAGATSVASSAYDDQMVSIGTDTLGTLTFWGHGGDTALGAYDDVTPKAYEEVWDIGAEADTLKIDGGGTNDMFFYESPTVQGVTVTAAYVPQNNLSGVSHYNDWGVKFAPEMVEGLTVYYAQGTQEMTATTEQDMSTIAVTYAFGPVTVGYQESELDLTGAVDDESEGYSIAYAVNDDLTISYGSREYNEDTSDNTTDGKLTQEDSGIAVSYTMGGVSIVAQQNDHTNVEGTDANDYKSYALGVSFAF